MDSIQGKVLCTLLVDSAVLEMKCTLLTMNGGCYVYTWRVEANAEQNMFRMFPLLFQIICGQAFVTNTFQELGASVVYFGAKEALAPQMLLNFNFH